MERIMWAEDPNSGVSYNAFCAFEVALMNLCVISEDEQLGLDETEVYIEVLDGLRN